VGNLESDPTNGMISIDAPIGRGLIGKTIGDEVSIETPSGQLNFEIEEVEHI
jgi:transcription elongation factor GreA